MVENIQKSSATPTNDIDPRSDVGEFLRLLAEVAHSPLNAYIVLAHICGLSNEDVAALVGLTNVSIGKRKDGILETEAGRLLDVPFNLHPAVDYEAIQRVRDRRQVSGHTKRGGGAVGASACATEEV